MESQEIATNFSNLNKSDLMDTRASLWAELLFTFLPFLIIALVSIYKNGTEKLLYIPEWSLAASILIGQAIVKFITGLLPFGRNLNLGVVSLVISSLIVLLLAPSLIVLALIMTLEDLPISIALIQVFLFIVAVIIFLFLGRINRRIYIQSNDDYDC